MHLSTKQVCIICPLIKYVYYTNTKWNTFKINMIKVNSNITPITVQSHGNPHTSPHSSQIQYLLCVTAKGLSGLECSDLWAGQIAEERDSEHDAIRSGWTFVDFFIVNLLLVTSDNYLANL